MSSQEKGEDWRWTERREKGRQCEDRGRGWRDAGRVQGHLEPPGAGRARSTALALATHQGGASPWGPQGSSPLPTTPAPRLLGPLLGHPHTPPPDVTPSWSCPLGVGCTRDPSKEFQGVGSRGVATSSAYETPGHPLAGEALCLSLCLPPPLSCSPSVSVLLSLNPPPPWLLSP